MMKRLLTFSVFCVALAIAPLAHAQVVIPTSFANVEGNSGGEGTSLGVFSNSAQIVYNESLLTAAGLNVGDVLTGLSFRLNAVDSAPIWSVNDYIIRLSTSNFSAGNLVGDFAANRGTDFTEVRNGALSYDGTEYDTSSTAPSTGPGVPNAFGPSITFNQGTFTYNGGDLLLEYTHSNIDLSQNAPGVQEVARADAVTGFAGVQSSFSPGFNTTDGLAFGGFGNEFAPIVQFDVTSVPEPTSAVLLMGLGLVGVVRRRR